MVVPWRADVVNVMIGADGETWQVFMVVPTGLVDAVVAAAPDK